MGSPFYWVDSKAGVRRVAPAGSVPCGLRRGAPDPKLPFTLPSGTCSYLRSEASLWVSQGGLVPPAKCKQVPLQLHRAAASLASPSTVGLEGPGVSPEVTAPFPARALHRPRSRRKSPAPSPPRSRAVPPPSGSLVPNWPDQALRGQTGCSKGWEFGREMHQDLDGVPGSPPSPCVETASDSEKRVPSGVHHFLPFGGGSASSFPLRIPPSGTLERHCISSVAEGSASAAFSSVVRSWLRVPGDTGPADSVCPRSPSTGVLAASPEPLHS